MATEQEQIVITLKAEADLSSYQYRAICVTNAGYGTLSAGTADNLIGVLLNKPAARDRAAKVAIGGHCKVIAGAAISTLGFIGDGRTGGGVQTVTTDGYSILGRNITTAAGTGEYVEVIIAPGKHG